MPTKVAPDGGVMRISSQGTVMIYPIEHIILGNGKAPRFEDRFQTAALLAIMRQQMLEQDGNTSYILCGEKMTPNELQDHLGTRVMPRNVYAVVHPDNIFEVVQNIRANPCIYGDPAKPTKNIKLYINSPKYTDLCLMPDGVTHSLRFTHRLLERACDHVDSISAVVDMNLKE